MMRTDPVFDAAPSRQAFGRAGEPVSLCREAPPACKPVQHKAATGDAHLAKLASARAVAALRGHITPHFIQRGETG